MVSEFNRFNRAKTARTKKDALKIEIPLQSPMTEFTTEQLGHSSVLTARNYLASFESDKKKEAQKALTNFGK